MSRRTTFIAPQRDILRSVLTAAVLVLLCFFAWQNGFFAKLQPFLARLDQREILAEEIFWQQEQSLGEKIWDMFLGYDPTRPDEQLTACVYLKQAKETAVAAHRVVYQEVEQEYYWDSAQALSSWDEMKAKFGQVHLSEEVQVIIYHTHNAETYKPTAGVSKAEGQNGGVVSAADVLAEALERKYGIRTAHSKTLHDYPDWSHSYINSLKTVKGLLNAYPEAKMVFDVHRDAGYTSKEATTTVINGQAAAKILLVIGANHENYQSNLAFARALEDKGAELYPELIKGIHIAQSSRYNQQVHDHAVIVEVGSDLNTQEEADHAMECFADICAQVLEDMD